MESTMSREERADCLVTRAQVVSGANVNVIYNNAQPIPIDIPFTFDSPPRERDFLGYFTDNASELAQDVRTVFEYCKKNSIKIDIHTCVLNGDMSFGVSLSKIKWGVDEHHSAKTLQRVLDVTKTALCQIQGRRDVLRA